MKRFEGDAVAKHLLAVLAALLLAAGCASDPERELARKLERADALFSSGEFIPAAEEWAEAAEIAQDLGPRANASLGSAYAGIGWVALESGQLGIAEDYFDRALHAKRAAGEYPSLDYGLIQSGLAAALERRGDIPAAIEWARSAVQTQVEAPGEVDGQALANARHQLARLLHKSQEVASSPAVQREAARLYGQVLTFQRSVLGEDSPDIVPYLRELEVFLVDLHDSPEMREVRAEAEAILYRAGFNLRETFSK